MALLSKPAGLLSRFNKASKAFLSATALGLMLTGSAMASSHEHSEAPPSSVTTQTALDNNGTRYEYNARRTIRLTGSINKGTAISVIEKLLRLSQNDPESDIELRINSGGGEVDAGLAIYDVMTSLPNDIRTVCEGEAQSMAALLLSAGAQGKRFAYPNCTIMFHQPSWGTNGQVTDMSIATTKSQGYKSSMTRILSERTGWPENIVRDLLERNFYPSAKEAREMGFIDNIIEDINPDPEPTPKTTLPDRFCDNPGRRHMNLCQP